MSARSADDRRDALVLGADAEAWCADLLARAGWTILARNWRGGGGELDIVVSRGDRLRFVEVKARDEGDPSGLEAVTYSKQRRLSGAAEAFLAGRDTPWREICFTVALVTPGAPPRVEWVDDAFDGV